MEDTQRDASKYRMNKKYEFLEELCYMTHKPLVIENEGTDQLVELPMTELRYDCNDHKHTCM